MTSNTDAGTARECLPPDVLERAAAGLGLLAGPMRLHIVWLLASGECDVTTLARRLGAAVPAVSQNLAKLKLGGLVRSRREGRRQVYLVDDPSVVTVAELMIAMSASGKTHSGSLRDRAV